MIFDSLDRVMKEKFEIGNRYIWLSMLSLPLTRSVTLDKSFISLDLNDFICKMEKVILFTIKGLI